MSTLWRRGVLAASRGHRPGVRA